MRFLEVRAPAFGPLDNARLTFAPGMTVVFGPNEAGKSSWHAALYAGLCGRKRGQGQPGIDDRAFRERHKPWDRSRWEAGALIALEDGRRVEVRHDLEGNVNCRATDADLGRDLSAEVMFEGSPDGAQFLGLDRRAFLATACIRQGDLLGILDNAKNLQEYLQRAAATAGTNDTAAGALDRLDNFQKANVGRDQQNATKPLRKAIEDKQQRQQELQDSRQAHEDSLDLAQRVEQLTKQAREAHWRVLALRAAVATRDSTAIEKRARRAQELADSRAPDRAEVGGADQELAQEVATAMHTWRDLPANPELVGDTTEMIEAALRTLPEAPGGDRAADPGVLQAAQEYRAAIRTHQEHAEVTPLASEPPLGGRVPEQEVRELARVLSASVPPTDPALDEQIRAARARLQAIGSNRGPHKPGLVVGGVVMLIGVALLYVGVIPALLVLLVGAAVVVWAFSRGGSTAEQRAELLEEITALQTNIGGRQGAADQVRTQQAEALARVQALGLPPDPTELRNLADEEARAQLMQRDLQQWQQRQQQLALAVSGWAETLRAALRTRNVQGGPDLLATVTQYEEECHTRACIASEAARRPDLEQRLAERQDLERMAADVIRRRQFAVEQLHRLAETCGVSGEDESALVVELQAWRQRWLDDAAARDQATAERGELDALLDGQSLDELIAEASRCVEHADGLRATVPAEVLAAVVVEPDIAQQRELLEREEKDLSGELAKASGQLVQAMAKVPSVSEAEEAVAAAESEVDRVRGLEHILNLTRTFLTAAQDRVHRDIAPVLASTVTARLQRVTGGRYVDARVDPANLDVQVQTAQGEWRRAALLSHGTAEQVYLLLRVALARHLTRSGEVCPLILDDVTAQSDTARTLAILDTLHELSREQQVILFTQDDTCLTWAEGHLDELSDQLVRLSVAVPVLS